MEMKFLNLNRIGENVRDCGIFEFGKGNNLFTNLIKMLFLNFKIIKIAYHFLLVTLEDLAKQFTCDNWPRMAFDEPK
jgi:hypothetical protein